MKRIFSIVAGLCCFWAAEAQSNFVFVNAAGETLADGATLTFTTCDPDLYEYEMIEISDDGLALKHVGSSNANCKLKYEITDILAGTDFSICCFEKCQPWNGDIPAYTLEAKNVKPGTVSPTMAHWSYYGDGGLAAVPAGSSCKVKLTVIETTSGEVAGPSLNVVFTYTGSANLGSVANHDEIVSIYSITGQRSDTLVAGVNIVRYKSGKCVKVLSRK